MKTICINCPMGCPLDITEEDGKIVVRGYTCKRGLEYGVSEYTAPVRTLTALMMSADGRVLPVKTSAPVPKDRMFDVLGRIRELTAPADPGIGYVVEKNMLGLGADIVVTGRPAPHQTK